ncbi:hypothetical protein [Caviibacter abscessus]|nr:hypothetical protein [Caviibacter abscessus]
MDMKTVGVIHTHENMLFRLLNHQVFLVFLIPFQILSVLNQKFISIQKNYLVLYTNDEVSNIKKTFYCIIAIEILFYILGQVFFQFVNYIFLGQVYMQYLNFNFLTIIEIVTVNYIIIFFLLIFKKDLFSYITYYILILLLLIYNNTYITIPVTVKFIKLLNDAPLKLLLSRIVWVIVSFVGFCISLYKYSISFYDN